MLHLNTSAFALLTPPRRNQHDEWIDLELSMLPNPFPVDPLDIEFTCPSKDFRYCVHDTPHLIALSDLLQPSADTVDEVREHMVRDCVNKKAYVQIKKEHDDGRTTGEDTKAARSVPVTKQKKRKAKRSRVKVGRSDGEQKARASALLTSFLNGGGNGFIDLMAKVLCLPRGPCIL